MNSLLGEGSYGKVFSKHKNDKKLAIKHIQNSQNSGIKNIPEINFLSFFFKSSPYIISMKQIKVDDKKIKVYFNQADIDLRKYIKNNKIEKLQIKKIILEILLALKSIHDANVIHQDIKPENILLFKQNKFYQSQLCDFGISCFFNPFEKNIDIASTPYYRAPEIYTQNYNKKIDIWALGTILYELKTNKILLSSLDNNINKSILHTIYNILPNECYPNDDIIKRDKNFFKKEIKKLKFEIEKNDEVYDLLINMLKIDPNERYDVNQCLNHPYFNDLKELINKSKKLIKIPNLIDVPIIQCNERKIMSELVKVIYNKKNDLKWYNDRILFQSISLFDKFLNSKYVKKINNDNEYEIIYDTSLIIASKNYALSQPININNYKNKEKIIKWEKKLIFKILNGITFYNNPYEIIIKKTNKLTKDKIFNLLKIYLDNEKIKTIDDVIKIYLNNK